MPKALTKEEMRDKFIDHCLTMVDYWSTITAISVDKEETETHARLSGLLFSIFAAIDGSSIDLPAFLLTPDPHPSDMGFDIYQGKDWWESKPINDECELHSILVSREKSK